MSDSKYTGYSWWVVAFSCLFLLITALHLYHLDYIALRGDEAYTAIHWTQTPFTTSWQNMVHHEPHPIPVFFIYWLWSGIAGNSAFALRSLSVLSSVVSLAGIIAISLRLFDKKYLVLGMALLWTLHPFTLWHAQDARIYSLLGTLNILNFYLLLRAVDKPKNETSIRGWQVWLPYLGLQLLTMYLYFFEGLSLLVHGLFILSLRRRDILLEAIRTWIVMLVLAIPLFINLYDVAVLNAYIPNSEQAQVSRYFSHFLGAYFRGEEQTIAPEIGIIVFAGLITALIIGLAGHRQRNSLIILWICIPPLALYIISLNSGYFRPRYGMTSLPAFLFAIVISTLTLAPFLFTGERIQKRFVSTVILLMALFFAYRDYQYFVVDEAKSPDWINLQTYLDTRMVSDDVVVISVPDPAIEYYHPESGDIHFYLPAESNVSEEVNDLAGKYTGIYLIGGAGMGDLEEKFQQDFQLISADEISMRRSSDVWHISQYRAWEVQETEITHPVNVKFGDIAILKGYSWLDGGENEDILLLYWYPLNKTESPLSILVHVVSPNDINGIPLAVLDHGLANSIISTTQWQEEVIYRDPIRIPMSMDARSYAIRVGLYETSSLEQIPLDKAELQELYEGRYPLILD